MTNFENAGSSTEHELSVTIKGYLWSGHYAECDYALRPSQQDDFKTLADFKQIAGDFETIQSATLCKALIVTDYEIASFN